MTWRGFLLPKPAPLLARAAVLTGLFPILGLLGGTFWALDLFNHFQRQYFLILLLTTLALLTLRSFRLAALSAAMLVIPLARIAPTWINPTPDPGSPSLRVAAFNVLSANRSHDDTLAWIRQTDPDLIFLPEVDPVWSVALKPLLATHPHSIDHIIEGNFGFALYSKLPILEHRIHPCGQMRLPLLIAKISGPLGEFTLLGAHPVPPTTAFWASERDAFLMEIARISRATPGPILLLGDLNATRWSHAMRPIFQAGWTDTSNGHGAPPTWMNANPLVAIPIDHVMFRPTPDRPFHCRNRTVGPHLGSDHRPVVAEIIW